MSTHSPTLSVSSISDITWPTLPLQDPPPISPHSSTTSASSISSISSISAATDPTDPHTDPLLLAPIDNSATSASHIFNTSAPNLDNEEPHNTRRGYDPPSAKPHDEYFKFMTVKVESTLFNLPEYVVKNHPTAFENILALRALDGTITLPDTSVVDFERFYIVLIPQDRRDHPSTLEEWTSVLQVAHNWGFLSIRNHAIARLKSLTTSVDKVVLGKKYEVPEWKAIGYSELCYRESPIDRREGARLGLDDVIDISNIRHHILIGLDSSYLSLTSGPLRQALGRNDVADHLAGYPTMSAFEAPLTARLTGTSTGEKNPLNHNQHPTQTGTQQHSSSQDNFEKPSFPTALHRMLLSTWAAILVLAICMYYSRGAPDAHDERLGCNFDDIDGQYRCK
ncbi:hypothetical protein BDN72DRAFT_843328 [Pluteus cervinus]|uniref:Uncharacterized protein n=1 Tax=Pluteus cervinus TaxID=181527 RepID=A0ACD3ANZ9_9AGAR|nr:hypothetical protein BDN72DRAFT_843328 [Pluteus cervinus]